MNRDLLIEAWKEALQVQRHFNDIAMKIRAFALTLIAAILTAESLVKSLDGKVTIGAALVCWLAFYLMDRFWYHYLLLGAVIHATNLEEELKKQNLTFEIERKNKKGETVKETVSIFGLTGKISELNQEGFFKWKAKYKIDLFYAIIAIAIISLKLIPFILGRFF